MGTEKTDWLPDWKDDKAYPVKVEDWSLFQWVWAFIRRNAEYRSDYVHFASLPSTDSDTLYTTFTSKWHGRGPFLDDDMSLRYCQPPAIPGETYALYSARLGGKIEVDMALEEHLMGKWGIGCLPDPSDDLGYRILFPPEDSPPEILRFDPPSTHAGRYTPPMPEQDESWQVTLRFDLRSNIKKQIKNAERILAEEKTRKKEGVNGISDLAEIRASTPQKTELLKYLRAFDAKVVGANDVEIGTKLYPEKNSDNSRDSMKQSGYRAAKAGKHLVEGGYKLLLKFW